MGVLLVVLLLLLLLLGTYEDLGIGGEVEEAEDADEAAAVAAEDDDDDEEEEDDEEDTEELADAKDRARPDALLSWLQPLMLAPDLAKLGESSLIGGVGMPWTRD